MNTEQENLLVEKAKTSIQAFDQLYRYYLAQIYLFCLNRIGNKEMAEDITSKTFLKAVEQIKKFDTKRGKRFKSWLYAIANNNIIDYFRSSYFNKTAVLETSKEVDKDTSIEKEVYLTELKKQILVTLRCLKPRYQQALSLHFFSELSNPEIAEIMSIKTKNVANLLHRSLKQFKKIFEKKYSHHDIFTFD